MTCHGDDFIAEGSAEAMRAISRDMRRSFDCKAEPWIGEGFSPSGLFLKRRVQWESAARRFTWQGDPRLIMQAAAALGIDTAGCKGAPSPGSRSTGAGLREGAVPLDDAGRALVY